ncbi:hypothetical protein HPNQ4076_0983 [Helicobacter pylori NQ4076]|uniref:Uncharacterized protein n=1 Tax=Helicobacter pylori NQ4076 TaxID=992029 RepID=J0JA80_HELPX|nr:hypothetical protein HPNQ4076_0983 [Helicobacter pylori NQ4076]
MVIKNTKKDFSSKSPKKIKGSTTKNLKQRVQKRNPFKKESLKKERL